MWKILKRIDRIDYKLKEYSMLIKEWLGERILKGLVMNGYEPNKYSNVLRNNSLSNWTWLIGRKLDVVCCDRWTNIIYCVHFLSSLYSLYCIFSSFVLTQKGELVCEYILKCFIKMLLNISIWFGYVLIG